MWKNIDHRIILAVNISPTQLNIEYWILTKRHREVSVNFFPDFWGMCYSWIWIKFSAVVSDKTRNKARPWPLCVKMQLVLASHRLVKVLYKRSYLQIFLHSSSTSQRFTQSSSSDFRYPQLSIRRRLLWLLPLSQPLLIFWTRGWCRCLSLRWRYPPTGKRARNFELEARSVIIENVRGKEDSVSLDTTGFQFYKQLKTFENDEEIRRIYFPESIELIKKLTGASRVKIFDHSK